MSEKSGGPAFPSSIIHEGHSHIVGFLGEQIEPGETSNYAGMSLRDYFAAKALPGLMGRSWPSLAGEDLINQWAVSAYGMADAMLAERAK